MIHALLKVFRDSRVIGSLRDSATDNEHGECSHGKQVPRSACACGSHCPTAFSIIFSVAFFTAFWNVPFTTCSATDGSTSRLASCSMVFSTCFTTGVGASFLPTVRATLFEARLASALARFFSALPFAETEAFQ